ncbi:MAG: hypothetical protein IPK03_08845 [Bacteroidetes bacterium]|nr:hypothetical protein [Bacteroidota bacterium]
MLKPNIEFAEEIVRIAAQASEEILAVYNEPIEVENKRRCFALTLADQRTYIYHRSIKEAHTRYSHHL